MYRITQIKLNLGENTTVLPQRILKKIGSEAGEITEYKIVKESIDARDKGDIKLVYSVDFDISGDASKLKLDLAPDTEYKYVESGSQTLKNRPVIVGFGPCGMFAALILSERGYKPLIIERGNPVEERVLDVKRFWKERIFNEESNVQFGEGGAGTFSDGKLTTQIKDIRIHKVLDELVTAGGGEDILYKQKPHIGTDVLRNVVVSIRNKVIANGGEIRFASKLTNVKIVNGSVAAVEINENEIIETENLIMAIGHSARDTFRLLNGLGVEMEQKPFSIGVRIEHTQETINKAQYGKSYNKMGAADYKLAHRCKNGRGVYTFCMCPGGEVIVASSQKGMVVTNGMSYHAREGKRANSGLLVDVRTEDFGSDHPLAGVEFQEKYERKAFEEGGGDYKAPKALWKDFVKQTFDGKRVRNCLPEFAVEALLEAMPYLGRKLRGFDSEYAILTAVESRSSSPVRIIRDDGLQSNYRGLYPAGEGAGYAGGITSAAVDGIKIAEQIVSHYKPLEK
jgi:uncharacterized FAD-dependent dehydrogenase